MEKIKLTKMQFPEDKLEIASWETQYGNSPEFQSIRHFILEDNTFTGLAEVIETNHEIFPIGEDEKKLAFVAKSGNEIVAWVLLDAFDLSTKKPQMFLQYIVINPMYQHQGYGTEIAKELFLSPEKFIGVKPTEIFATIDSSNAASILLFSKFNFSFIPIDKDYFQAITKEPKLISSKDSPIVSFEL